MTPVYQATAQLLIERENPNVLSFNEVAEIDSASFDYYQTQYEILESRSLARKVIEGLDLARDTEFGGLSPSEPGEATETNDSEASPQMERVIDALLERLSIEPIRKSQLVAVRFESVRPHVAARVVNYLTQQYIRLTLDFRYQTSSEASEWLQSQIDEQRRQVEQADLRLQKTKEDDGIVNIEERRILLEQQLRELGTALTALKTERLEKLALFNQMQSVANPEELPEVLNSRVSQALWIELARLERDEAQLLERYLEQHPEVLRVRRQIEETREMLNAEAQRIIHAAQNDYEAARAREASVDSALETAKSETLELSRRAIHYDTLQRELDASVEVLNSMLARLKETDVARELKASNIRILDTAAVPRDPVRPRKLLEIGLACLAGLFLGVGAAFLLNYLDDTFQTPEDVRAHTGAPLLGVIPETDLDTNGGLLAVTPGPCSEGYRGIRTALSYSWSEPGARSLLVTSTAPGEGKTLTSTNLALALAATEASVLLIDCDLRRPTAHRLLKARRTPGLSDVLTGKMELQKCRQTVQSGRLDFLSSGAPTPSPAELLGSRTFATLLGKLGQLYDWIVLDSTPVGAVADALTLARLTSGAVLVVGAEMVPRRAVRLTLERIHATGSRVLGVVLNRAHVERHSYYYGRYYGHSYGDSSGLDARQPSPKSSSGVARIASIRSGR